MVSRTQFEDVCEVTNIKNGITVTAEILEFRERKYISATINRAVKINLRWNDRAELYLMINDHDGVELSSTGPKSYTYRTTR